MYAYFVGRWLWYKGHLVAPWMVYFTYTHQWLHRCESYLVHIPHISQNWQIRRYHQVWGTLFQPIAALLGIMVISSYQGTCAFCTPSYGSLDIWYMKLQYPNNSKQEMRIYPSLGCPRSHKRGLPCGRLWFPGRFGPKLYVPSILGPWVQRLFGTYSSYTRLTVESKSRTLPILGCCHSHKRGHPCGRLWFRGSLHPVLYVQAILGLWV